MRVLTWDEFNVCVKKITYLCKDKNLSGVYGFPRGGLCLAVAISHSLQLPLLNEPKPFSLVLDDVSETGLTLNRVKDISGVIAFVWISKIEVAWFNAVETCPRNQWIVFPWENIDFVEKDMCLYRLKRSLI